MSSRLCEVLIGASGLRRGRVRPRPMVENDTAVDCARVASQEQGIAVHELVEDQGLVVIFQTEALHAAPI